MIKNNKMLIQALRYSLLFPFVSITSLMADIPSPPPTLYSGGFEASPAGALPGVTFPSFQSSSFNTANYTFGIAPQSSSSPLQGQLIGPSALPGAESVLEQVYPQPAHPPSQSISQNAGPAASSYGQKLRLAPMENVAQPKAWQPGLATIRDGMWAASDFFYQLPTQIGVKVEVVQPAHKQTSVNGLALEEMIKNRLAGVNMIPEAKTHFCHPPLPFYHALVMVYSCEKRDVAFILVQLYEKAQLPRVPEDINGIWQVVTWQREVLVASPTEQLAEEIAAALDKVTGTFIERFMYYNPPALRPCFPQ